MEGSEFWRLDSAGGGNGSNGTCTRGGLVGLGGVDEPGDETASGVGGGGKLLPKALVSADGKSRDQFLRSRQHVQHAINCNLPQLIAHTRHLN